jgi:16S rRNA (guanine1516-N2)-methyltransferase
METTRDIIVLAGDGPEARARTERLAARLGAPHRAAVDRETEALVLAEYEGGLELRGAGAKPGTGLSVDFRRLDLRPGSASLSKRQPLARALGRRAETIVDATAGLGRDAMLIAAMGWTVLALERSPILAALLEDGLRRAATDPRLAPFAARIEVRHADARDVLPSLSPAVVYVDPMFPPRRKRSALPRKEILLVRQLIGEDPDAAALVDASRAVATDRVIVKRPREAEPLAPNPSLRFESKLARYDVYLAAGRERNEE